MTDAKLRDPETLAALRTVPVLATLDETSIQCLDGARDYWTDAGSLVVGFGERTDRFWILLEGSIQVAYPSEHGPDQIVYVMESGASFGEVPLLASVPAPANLRAATPCHLLELDEEHFWTLMNGCPGVRKAILGNMALRLAKVQQTTF